MSDQSDKPDQPDQEDLIVSGDRPLSIPGELPVLPLRDTVLFPYVVTPVVVGRPASLGALEAAAGSDGLLFVVAFGPGRSSVDKS